MTGTNFSDWFNASEGTFVAEASIPAFSATSVVQATQFCVSDGTGSNLMRVRGFSNGTGGFNWDATGLAGGVSQFDTTERTYSTLNTTVKNALAYKLNDVANSVNAQAVSTDNTVTLPVVDRAHIGSTIGLVDFGAQHIKRIFYYPQRLTNAEVQAFSK